MSEKLYQKAMFEGLVFDETGAPVTVAFLGGEAHYVISDDGFNRHVEAKAVDRQVLEWLQGQVFANKDVVTEGVMSMLGKDDLFTKAMIDSSIKNIDGMMAEGIPDDARMWLGMMGFKIIVDIHGDIVKIDAPAQELPPDFE